MCNDSETTTTRAPRERNRAAYPRADRRGGAGLHTSVGPARTRSCAIAERAGVQRHTVYAHFPDEASIFRACTGHWLR